MKSIVLVLISAGIAGAALIACSDDDATPKPNPQPTTDAAVPDANAADAASADAATNDAGPSDAGNNAGDGGLLPPNCLPASTLAPYATLEAAFPFCATRIVTAPAGSDVGNAKWGNHGGPLGTEIRSNPLPPAPPTNPTPKLSRFVLPATASGAATRSTFELIPPPNALATKYFWGNEVVETPFDQLLASYTTTDATFTGEALLYSPTGDAVRSRVRTNGFYSGAVEVVGGKNILAYAGLSQLQSVATNDKNNGLYIAQLCATQLAGSLCLSKSELAITWPGSSGPVALDGNGNALVAASFFSNDAAKNRSEVYGINLAAVLTLPPIFARPGIAIATAPSSYAGSFTAAWERGQTSGYTFFVDGYAPNAEPRIGHYILKNNVVEVGNTMQAKLTPSAAVASLGFFTAPNGVLWMSVATTGGAGVPLSAFIELRRTP